MTMILWGTLSIYWTPTKMGSSIRSNILARIKKILISLLSVQQFKSILLRFSWEENEQQERTSLGPGFPWCSYLYSSQKSPPAWTQEAYRPLRSKYSLCCPISGGKGTPVLTGGRGGWYPSLARGVPQSWPGGTPSLAMGATPPGGTDKLKLVSLSFGCGR